MKLGKTSLLILILGIFIIAFGSLGIARSQQVDQQSQLEDELSVAEKRLSNLQLKELHLQGQELEEEINQARTQLQAAKDVFSQSIESIDVTDSLFDIAEACDVVINEINSSAITKGALGDITLPVIKLTLNVEGDVPNLISFVTKLNNDFVTGVAESAEIGIPGTSDNETQGEPEEAAKPSAVVRLIIYNYQDD